MATGDGNSIKNNANPLQNFNKGYGESKENFLDKAITFSSVLIFKKSKYIYANAKLYNCRTLELLIG